ncbi:MAG: AbrB family transcriptional regulator [Rubrivivax sp.]
MPSPAPPTLPSDDREDDREDDRAADRASDRAAHRTARALRLGGTLAGAALAAVAAAALHMPLPWLIGPLVVSALAGVLGVPLLASQRLRNVGQWAIGVTLGLYFTPEVVGLVARLAPAIGVGVVWALGLGWAFHRLLQRWNPGLDAGTTFFSAAIGGASEMAVLADRHGARIDRVAAAHSLRVLIVVLVLPFALLASGVHGLDPQVPVAAAVRPLGLAQLAALTLVGVALMGRLGLPNPWVLGALAVTAALTSAGVTWSALPPALTHAGQLFIGVALGARFTPAFAHAAPRWLASIAGGTLVLIAVSAGFGALLAHATGLHPSTGVLATAPGGIAEMCITAQGLQLGVPVVTAFHVLRYLAVLLLTAPLFRWEQRRLRRRSAAAAVSRAGPPSVP